MRLLRTPAARVANISDSHLEDNPKGFTIVRLPSGVKLKQGHKAPMLVGTVTAASVLLPE
jgi:hypothetical protein